MVFINIQTTRNNAPDDSGAIFGGRLEDGYKFAGYVISDLGDTLKICSAELISSTEAVTAAHCIDNSFPKYFGIGNYTPNQSDYIHVKKVSLQAKWDKDNKIENDLGLILLEEPIILNEYAELAKPKTGCNYVVVGYGKQDNSDEFNPLRKSADVCIKDLNYLGSAISFTGEDGGLCFGDSGSGVFEKDTNKLVTIASSIDDCYIGNFAAGAKVYEKVDLNNFAISINANSKKNCGYIDTQNNNIIDDVDRLEFISNYLEYCDDTSIIDSTLHCGPKDINFDSVIDLKDLSKFAAIYEIGSC